MIDGLKLTMTGEELRKRLDQRVKEHERQAAHYKREAKRDPDPDDKNDFGLPEHVCEHGEEFHAWRAKALAYIREHVEGGEVYRLGQGDLAFGEILPDKPGVVARNDYERDHRIGFSLERIANEIGRARSDPFGLTLLQVPRLTAPSRAAPRAPAARRPANGRSK